MSIRANRSHRTFYDIDRTRHSTCSSHRANECDESSNAHHLQHRARWMSACFLWRARACELNVYTYYMACSRRDNILFDLLISGISLSLVFCDTNRMAANMKSNVFFFFLFLLYFSSHKSFGVLVCETYLNIFHVCAYKPVDFGDLIWFSLVGAMPACAQPIATFQQNSYLFLFHIFFLNIFSFHFFFWLTSHNVIYRYWYEWFVRVCCHLLFDLHGYILRIVRCLTLRMFNLSQRKSRNLCNRSAVAQTRTRHGTRSSLSLLSSVPLPLSPSLSSLSFSVSLSHSPSLYLSLAHTQASTLDGFRCADESINKLLFPCFSCFLCNFCAVRWLWFHT